MIYHKIRIMWICPKTGDAATLVKHNCTIESAMARAREFGYVKPKWYEVWRPHALIDLTVGG